MLSATLGRARRRILSRRLFHSFLVSGAVCAGCLICVIVLGTERLGWWAPASLLVASLIIGLVVIAASAPTDDQAAQLLDRRCSLADTLATAVYFRDSAVAMAVAQRRKAESQAAQIDISQALPFPVPRAAYVFAVLGVAAAALVLMRYGSQKQLDLRAPIVPLPFLASGTNAVAEQKAQREARERAEVRSRERAMDRLGTSTSDRPGENDVASAPESAVTNEANGKDGENGPATEGKKPDGSGTEASDSAQQGTNSSKDGVEQPPSSRDGSEQSAQGGAKPSGNPNSSGLMSKLRDAVSGLMSKLQQPKNNPQTPAGAPGAQQANGKQASGQQSAQKPGAQDPKGNPSEQEGQESAAESEQMAPGKGSGKSSDQNASAKPGSGMGHQDGSKELKDAEQLSAMGKLSEIIGKRSANITGEMTIEPQSGPQQLRTGYTRSDARHGEASGDVNRDEVPVEMQSYVEQYFDQVRKQAAVKAARAARSRSN